VRCVSPRAKGRKPPVDFVTAYTVGDDYEFFGYTSQEQAEFAYSALSRRLKVIGVPLATATV
jgi:hypothetical protein